MINYILGGQGLIGSVLNSLLIESGEKTKVFDLKSGWDLRINLPIIDDEEIYCWFLAWDTGGSKFLMPKENQATILYNNLVLCNVIFPWIADNKIPFTFVSSQLAGYPNAYGLAKQIGEFWSDQLPQGLIARLWNVYGMESVGLRSHVVNDLISQGLKGCVKLMTNGKERRQFIHVKDCVEALLHQRKIRQNIADITSNEWVPIRRIAEMVSEELKVPLSIGLEIGYENIVEPINQLDWQPKIKLSTGVCQMIQEMRKLDNLVRYI